MNLHHLYYFQGVANLQSFTKASELLYVSQPTLSYAISSLEKELGVSLILRNGRSATLTEDGKVFLGYINTALKDLESGIQFLRDRSDPAAHSVRILSDRIMAIVPEIKHFRQDFDCNNITFSLDRCTSESPEKHLLKGAYDIGFQRQQPISPGLEYIQIPEPGLVLIVPLDNALSIHESIDLREVDWGQKVVLRQPKTPDPRSYQIASLYQQAGYDVANAISSAETTLGVATLVEAGFGISVVPMLEHLDDYAIKILPITYPPSGSTYYMLRRRDPSSISASSRFFTYVATRYGQFDTIKL